MSCFNDDNRQVTPPIWRPVGVGAVKWTYAATSASVETPVISANGDPELDCTAHPSQGACLADEQLAFARQMARPTSRNAILAERSLASFGAGSPVTLTSSPSAPQHQTALVLTRLSGVEMELPL